MSSHQAAYNVLAESLTAQGIDVEQVKTAIKNHKIETPSRATPTAARARHSLARRSGDHPPEDGRRRYGTQDDRHRPHRRHPHPLG